MFITRDRCEYRIKRVVNRGGNDPGGNSGGP
jgi:hypothetical protein